MVILQIFGTVRIYDEHWRLKGYIQNNRVYDEHWRHKGYIENGGIYDKHWYHKGYIEKDGKCRNDKERDGRR